MSVKLPTRTLLPREFWPALGMSFLKAADHIEQVGWCQNRDYDRDDRRCAGYAINAAWLDWRPMESPLDAWTDFRYWIGRATPPGALVDIESTYKGHSIVKWNDDKNRTREEIYLTLRKAGDMVLSSFNGTD